MCDFYVKIADLTIDLKLINFKRKEEATKIALFHLLSDFIDKKDSLHGRINIISTRRKRNILEPEMKAFFEEYFDRILLRFPKTLWPKGELKYHLHILSSYAHDERLMYLINAVKEKEGRAYIIFCISGFFFLHNIKARESFVFLDITRYNADFISIKILGLLRYAASLLHLDSGGLLLHAAAVNIGSKGYLFLGDTGSGKSTILSLVPQNSVFGDETIVVRKRGDGYFMWPGPYGYFDSDGSFINNLSRRKVKVRKIFSLVKDNKTYTEHIATGHLVAETLYEHPFFARCLNRDLSTKMVDLLFDLFHSVPCYRLHFKKNREFLRYLV
ncbi:MAG: hypothetical protein AMJ45_03515 [Syntrophobacter sp. DG_60]|nr:MAG: hypothetical protein AMJ45_03515 [Syntrophobacter sp. DG_60]